MACYYVLYREIRATIFRICGMDERGVICRFRCVQKLGKYFLIYVYNILIKLISLKGHSHKDFTDFWSKLC